MPIVNHMFSLGSDRLCIRQETGIVHTITYSCFLTCNTKYNNKHASWMLKSNNCFNTIYKAQVHHYATKVPHKL